MTGEPSIGLWQGSRDLLLPLFELADDSPAAIASYIARGDILVATMPEPVGHLQFVEGERPGEFEIKSLAVAEPFQMRGLGSGLVDAAVQACIERGAGKLTVSTAICAFDALRFYLKLGFRVSGFRRNAFTEAAGYPADLRIDGIPLNDALMLEREIDRVRSPS